MLVVLFLFQVAVMPDKQGDQGSFQSLVQAALDSALDEVPRRFLTDTVLVNLESFAVNGSMYSRRDISMEDVSNWLQFSHKDVPPWRALECPTLGGLCQKTRGGRLYLEMNGLIPGPPDDVGVVLTFLWPNTSGRGVHLHVVLLKVAIKDGIWTTVSKEILMQS
jgi:hypothetical protein